MGPSLRLALACCAGGLALGLAGCGSEKLLPVAGTVTINGQPLAAKSGWVAFYPAEEKAGQPLRFPLTELKPGGRYEMLTNGKLGVPPGKYKVVVMATDDEI